MSKSVQGPIKAKTQKEKLIHSPIKYKRTVKDCRGINSLTFKYQ